MNENGADCGTLAARTPIKADFTNLAAADKTYTFTATTTNVSNVRFVVIDNEGCVTSTSNLTPNGTGALANGSSVTLTVNYQTTLNAATSVPLIQNRTRDQAVVVMVYVVYNNGSQDVSIPMRITIQDCSCCGAFVAAGVWKQFMCYNLGATESVDPFTPSWQTNGAYYQWGRKDPAASAPNSTGADANPITWNPLTPSGWFGSSGTSDPGANDVTKSAYDPCPTGYRIPSYAEWNYLRQNNAITSVGSWTSAINAGTDWAGYKFGPALMLPGAGYYAGQLRNRGFQGLYWSNRYLGVSTRYALFFGPTTAGSPGVSTYGPTDANSIRCIAQ